MAAEATANYIAKYNLEAELSKAVNLAIKENSEDPYRVISDYLRTLAEDDDEDEMIMEEDEMPVMKPRGKRQQVVAAAFTIPDNWESPVFEKEATAMEFLKEVMLSNRLMKSLAPSDREMLIKAFKPVSFVEGDQIIKQGDSSDNMDFYVLESGTCDISITGKGTVMKATKGIAFGELALLHNAPRAATVTAEGPVTAFALDMISFKMILMGKSQKDAVDYVAFLKNIPLLSKLDTTALTTVAACLKETEHAAGKNIIVEGDEGNSFYIILDGEVKCTKVGVAGEVSQRLTKGDFFGELALIDSDKRQASVQATALTKTLELSRMEFTRLLGDMAEDLKTVAAAKRASTS